ncbi:MAG TPA: cytochrome c oxidase assembly protein [Sphingomicrobium sp.]|nr:cytochrome c oxidase assembly protein [Sphingomicrobium sp.]
MTALAQRNARTGLLMALFAAAMVGVAFAAVPLYQLFCEVTGFAGTTVRAEQAPGAIAGEVGVRFDANVAPTLPWRFEPVQRTVRIAPGARTQVLYRAANLTARATTGTAVFNVTPLKAGQYFSKIECFCFTEQTLEAGERVDMPVVFFVDPRIRTDPDTRHIDEITLSYTFYPVESAGTGG